jgi:hypothetical protein
MVGWTDLTSVFEHFSQLILMAALILGNQAIIRRAQHRRVRGEVQRIRYLLRGGLQALRDLYDDNLRLLASGDGLGATRSPCSVSTSGASSH